MGILAYFLVFRGEDKITIENDTREISGQKPAEEIQEEEVAKEELEEKIKEPEKILPKEPVKPQEEKPVQPGKPAENNSFITKKLVNFGFQTASNRTIDTIIIHSSYDALGKDPYDVDGIISIYKSYGVAAHYLIDRDGKIYQLVEEKNIAYHAGVSKVPDGRTNVNSFSIGIELVNTKTDKYTDAQYKSLNKLNSILKDRYEIKYVLGHNEIAPERKDDPWNFDRLRITN